MSAIIIILPQPVDTSPSECDPCAPVDLRRIVLSRPPPRSKPHLVFDQARVMSDADFDNLHHGG